MFWPTIQLLKIFCLEAKLTCQPTISVYSIINIIMYIIIL